MHIRMKRFAILGLALSIVSLAPPAQADDAIFAPNVQPLPQVAADVAASPTQEFREKVVASAAGKLDQLEANHVITAEQKVVIQGWFKELPFHRVIDLELLIPGIPDFIGLCAEINPASYLSIEGCAGTILFISSLSVNVKSRFLHYVNITKEANGSYHGHEFGVGPGLGVRKMTFFAFDSGGEGIGFDAMLSAEWVYWTSRYFGISLQLDAGALEVYAPQFYGQDKAFRTLPYGKLSFGLSF